LSLNGLTPQKERLFKYLHKTLASVFYIHHPPVIYPHYHPASAGWSSFAGPAKLIAMSLIPEIKPGQSLELLKELHILTRDGKINQDTRRKLKQVYHLYQFIEPLLNQLVKEGKHLDVVDHGAGKSYLGFILYDLFFKSQTKGKIFGIETRPELVSKSEELAKKLHFPRMEFLNLSVEESITSTKLPLEIGMVTALHACNTATDDAIDFGLKKKAKYFVLVPCCQAEVAAELRRTKNQMIGKSFFTEIWRHPIHTREFGSHLTNVMRCLKLESNGYKVTVTELVGWEHSMKNELIIAEYIGQKNNSSTQKLESIIEEFGLKELKPRFLN
jgi:hypothetical protein